MAAKNNDFVVLILSVTPVMNLLTWLRRIKMLSMVVDGHFQSHRPHKNFTFVMTITYYCRHDFSVEVILRAKWRSAG